MKIEIRNILCGVDFSESGNHAYEYAVAIARRHGAMIELLHVMEPSAYAKDLPLEGEENDETFEASLRDELQKMADTADVPVQVKLAAGVPYLEIVDRAKSLPADFVVIGTHGRTGFKHLLIGSVAERVVRLAPCPVLTVRHADYHL